MSVETVSIKIACELVRKGKNKKDLIPVLNLSEQTVYARFVANSWTIKELEKVAEFLGVEPGNLI